MKLNNRGYLLVEVIVASVIAMTLAYFLIDLTMKLTNQNDDYVVATLLETEKVLMTRDFMNDLSKYKLQKIETGSSYVQLTFEPTAEESDIVKRITIVDKVFKYGDYSEGAYIENENYIEKKFDDKLEVNSVTINNLCYIDNAYIACPTEFSSLIVEGIVNVRVDAKTSPVPGYEAGRCSVEA